MPIPIKHKSGYEKLENFVHAFGAARLLLQRAHDDGYLLEGLVLYASIVDGFCRIALILKEQLEKKNDEINMSYIYQDSNNDYYSERKIYHLVYNKKIINHSLYKEINTLYAIRNKAIHRFFISEIEYSHLEIVLKRFEHVYQKLRKIVYDLESEQIEKGVGMVVLGRYLKTDKNEIKDNILKKIKSGSEKTLAKTLGCLSVEEIVGFASQKGLLQKCKKCNHLKVEHLDMSAFKKEKGRNINLDNYLSICWSKKCKCKKYE